jgi:hypothetical protein
MDEEDEKKIVETERLYAKCLAFCRGAFYSEL